MGGKCSARCNAGLRIVTFRVLRRFDIEAQLAESGSVILASCSEGAQSLIPIETMEIDFGLSHCIEPTVGKAISFEAEGYHYVSKGMVECRDLDSGAVHRFFSGDFFAIAPGTRYILRTKQDTLLFFAKCPGGTAEHAECADHEARDWTSKPLRAERLDHSGDNGPAANSMVPGASAAVIDDQRRLLMVKRRDSGMWTMPGGAMEIGDSLTSCVRREVAEETAVDVEVRGIIGTYSDPQTRVAYSDGEVRREFTILFHCQPIGGSLTINDESVDGCWADLDRVLDLPMVASQRRRIKDVVAFITTGAVAIR
jgi:8-oxo-dGTP diphosphatase